MQRLSTFKENVKQGNALTSGQIQEGKEVKGVWGIPRELVFNYLSEISFGKKTERKEDIALIPEVEAFKKAIFTDPVLRMNFEDALGHISEGGALQHSSPHDVFAVLNIMCTEAPKFYQSDLPGLPFTTLLLDLSNSHAGQKLFSSSVIASHLKAIFNAACKMYQSPASTKYLNEEEPFGWFCPTAQKLINWDDFCIDKSKPYWGFTSWNDWFTRSLRPEARPVAQGENIIVHSSDAFPV